jgi:tripartite-type tricarboxylate transporter receptor subunit TctC
MRTSIALLCTMVGWLTSDVALAQSWPQQPVKLVVPFGPGGNTDLVARITAERLGEIIGQRFLIENKLGASGAIAAEFVARSAPDGHTLFIGSTPQISVLPIIGKVNYDPQRDFVPIAIIATNPFVLGIHPSIPAKTLREFIDYVKARPGQLNYGSGGTGTIGHLCAALFLSRAGLTMTHVPYKSGPLGVTDLVAGQLQMYFGTATDIIPHMRNGKLTVLGVSWAQRYHEIPDVPAIAETFPGFDMPSWSGLLAPAGTPKPIVERLASEVSRVLKEPAVIDRIRKIGLEPSGITLDDFANVVKKEHPFWIEVVTLAGAKAQ